MSYIISSKRKERIDFHVKSDDYFGTLATVLDLRRQIIETGENDYDEDCALLERLKDDLVYLDKNYTIYKKK